jgi:hypothetical protein
LEQGGKVNIFLAAFPLFAGQHSPISEIYKVEEPDFYPITDGCSS